MLAQLDAKLRFFCIHKQDKQRKQQFCIRCCLLLIEILYHYYYGNTRCSQQLRMYTANLSARLLWRTIQVHTCLYGVAMRRLVADSRKFRWLMCRLVARLGCQNLFGHRADTAQASTLFQSGCNMAICCNGSFTSNWFISRWLDLLCH